MEMVERDYKFYFAFENSICDDYVTEKLWRALRMNIVPVVLGGYNYSELLPQKSYIDIKDFSSPEKLADYLQVLNGDDNLYNEYGKVNTRLCHTNQCSAAFVSISIRMSMSLGCTIN